MLFFLVNEQIYLKGEFLAFLGLLTTCLRKTIPKRKKICFEIEVERKQSMKRYPKENFANRSYTFSF